MKKNYAKNLLIATAVLISGTAFAQQTARDKAKPVVSANQRSTRAVMQTGDDGAQHLYQPNAGGNTAGSGCDSIMTTFAMGNGLDGTMLNVVANVNINISYIDCILVGDTDMVYIYHRTGSMTGHETSATGWSKDSVMMVLPVQDSLYRIPIYLNLPMNAGDTMAFYVTGSGRIGVDYTNGTAIGNLYTQDFGMKVLEGTGVSYPFGPNMAARVFNGVINYCPAGINPCESTATIYAGGNGFDGNMFDVTSTQDIVVTHLSGNINGTGYMKIYYHAGTFVGTETNPAAWTLIDSVMTTSVVPNAPTPIPINFSLNIAAGQTMAFYVTGNLSGADVNYTDGTAVGNVVVNDGIITIKEGTGQGYPFQAPITTRIWNGTMDYCLATGIDSHQNENSVATTVYPNPVNNSATLSIKSEKQLDHVSVIITDISGRAIQNYVNIQGNTVAIDATDLSGGMYIYNVYNGAELISAGKFIVE